MKFKGMGLKDEETKEIQSYLGSLKKGLITGVGIIVIILLVWIIWSFTTNS